MCDIFAPVAENMEDALITNVRVQSSIRPKPTFLSTLNSVPVLEAGAVNGPFEVHVNSKRLNHFV